MKPIVLHNREFVPYLNEKEIQARVAEMGAEISKDYEHEQPFFIGVLNGSFRFAADLFRHIEIPCVINFVKLTSYRGTESLGRIQDHIGLNSDIAGKHIVILEDIIDTGNTIEYMVEVLKPQNPASIRVATLLFKPEAYLAAVQIDYRGFEIPNLFVVGYGLDYDGHGRNLNNIYQIKH